MSERVIEDEDYWEYLEDAFDEINFDDGEDEFRWGYRHYPNWIGDLFSVQWLLLEIEEGGLMQFFLKKKGVLAPEALLGLQRMGLNAAAVAIFNAIAVFGEEYPRNWERRERFLCWKVGLLSYDNDHGLSAPVECYAVHSSELFSPMEKAFRLATGVDFSVVYDRMNEYARENSG